MNFVLVQKAIDAMKTLDEKEKQYVINQLVKDEDLSLMPVIYAETQRLEEYRRKARSDIYKLGQVGLHLAEKQIKQIPKIKSDHDRNLQAAFARTLFASRAMEGTKFQDELIKGIDFSSINEKWYRECWALETVKPAKDES